MIKLHLNKKERDSSKINLFFIFFVLIFLNISVKAKESILVVGGTGRVGSEIVKVLSMENKEITVLSRSTDNYSRLINIDINYLLGDVMNPSDMERIFSKKKYDVIINAIAKVGDSPNPHAIGQDNLIEWSSKMGVQQFILIGSVGAGPKQSKLVSDRVWSMWKDILQEKGRAEKALIDSSIPFTIIRTGIILYKDTPATGKALLSEDESLVGIITRKDLAQLTNDCVLNSQCFDNIYHAFDLSLGSAIE